MSALVGWPVPPRGLWSPRQAEVLLDALAEAAAGQGLALSIEAAEPVDGHARVRIVAVCRRHGEPVPADAACRACLREWPPP
jgi:hypothetical protein